MGGAYQATSRLSEHQLTERISKSTQHITNALQREFQQARLAGQQQNYTPARLINFLLFNDTGQPITSLEALNDRWKQTRSNNQQLVELNGLNQPTKQKLLNSLTIHLQAIAAGFNASQQTNYSEHQEINRRQQIVVVNRVTYYGGYRSYHDYRDDFWRDMFFIHLLNDWSWHSHYGYGHQHAHRHHGGSHDSDMDLKDCGEAAAIIFVILLVCAAIAASAYLFLS